MNLDFTYKLNLRVCKSKISAQKINNLKLNTFDVVITLFFIKNKEKRCCILEKTFLLADINMNISLGILFFTVSNVKIDFVNCYIYSKKSIIAEILLATKQFELIGRK